MSNLKHRNFHFSAGGAGSVEGGEAMASQILTKLAHFSDPERQEILHCVFANVLADTSIELQRAPSSKAMGDWLTACLQDVARLVRLKLRETAQLKRIEVAAKEGRVHDAPEGKQ